MTSPNQADAPTLTEVVIGAVRSARPAGAVIARLREERQRLFETLITHFFNDVERALGRAFDPTQLAPEQPILFYAQRQLQAHRQSLVAAFLRELGRCEPGPPAASPSNEWPHRETLARANRLPEPAPTNSIRRATAAVLTNLPNTTEASLGECLRELTALSGLPLGTPSSVDTPLLPLRQAFTRAISVLDTDARVLQLLAALFERLVLGTIELNSGEVVLHQPVTDDPSSDLSSSESGTGNTPMESLLQALDRLQHKTLISINTGQESTAPLLLEMHADPTQDGLDPAARENYSRAIAAIMAPALTLISQLFATARGSSGRPSEVEELLARLHVPLLKLAVIDPMGFQQPTHPGRELLRLLIEASAHQREHGRCISSRTLSNACTTRILRDFARDPTLFAQVTEGLRIALQTSDRTEILPLHPDAERASAERFMIKLGTWVELHRPETAALRCRLQSISDVEGRYVFENQRGFEVLALNRQELALALISGSLQILTDSACFERSLSTLIGVGHVRTATG